jgi:hypothetical protein
MTTQELAKSYLETCKANYDALRREIINLETETTKKRADFTATGGAIQVLETLLKQVESEAPVTTDASPTNTEGK